MTFARVDTERDSTLTCVCGASITWEGFSGVLGPWKQKHTHCDKGKQDMSRTLLHRCDMCGVTEEYEARLPPKWVGVRVWSGEVEAFADLCPNCNPRVRHIPKPTPTQVAEEDG